MLERIVEFFSFYVCVTDMAFCYNTTQRTKRSLRLAATDRNIIYYSSQLTGTTHTLVFMQET